MTYIVLVIAFAFTSGALVASVATGALGAGEELTSPADLSPLDYLALLPGALSIALAGILVIALAAGRPGLRDLRLRLLRWRVGFRWYAVALLTAPVLETAILGAFWLTSRDLLPGINSADDTVSLIVAGLVMGLVIPFFEEIGWTGFATAELGKRHEVLATGLIVGLPWCVLHVPLYVATATGGVPPAIYVPVMTFSILLPYRVLMVWVYTHTRSVLTVVLMHLSINVYAFTLPPSPAMAGVPDLVFNLALGAALWAIVAAVVAADRRKVPVVEPTRTMSRVP